MTEQSRALPNTPNRSQRELPIGQVEQSDEAYLAALGTSGSVEERSSTPVSVTSVSVSGSGAASRLPSAAERGERDDCLRDHVAWRQLQTRHFRDAAGKPAIAVGALQPCFYAAVEAGLLDNEPEHKIRFLAAAYDLAHQVPRWDAQQRRDVGVRSPAVCLRRRVERGALFRASPEGHAWAKKIVFPGVWPAADRSRMH